jgi:hypothetical protein
MIAVCTRDVAQIERGAHGLEAEREVTTIPRWMQPAPQSAGPSIGTGIVRPGSGV